MKNKIITIFISLTLAILAGCSNEAVNYSKAFDFQNGDLLFTDSDCGPLCDAIEKVTDGYNGYNITHVGIVEKESSNDTYIIEAAGKAGVQKIPVEQFLARSSMEASGKIKVIAGRFKPQYQSLVDDALVEADNLIGSPYDKIFEIDNGKYYCSELIYEIFKSANDDQPVFQLFPMTFKDPDTGEFFPAWIDYYQKLSVPIPQSMLGLNPGGISRSDKIDIYEPWGKCSVKN